jgi:hypothetical protein
MVWSCLGQPIDPHHIGPTNPFGRYMKEKIKQQNVTCKFNYLMINMTDVT